MDIKTEINECLELYHKLKEEYPQELNLDELHEVTGKYSKIKEYRDRISEYPKEVQTICEFLLATRCSDTERSRFFSYICGHPKAFSTDKKETFVEKRQRIADMAKEIGIETSIADSGETGHVSAPFRPPHRKGRGVALGWPYSSSFCHHLQLPPSSRFPTCR